MFVEISDIFDFSAAPSIVFSIAHTTIHSKCGVEQFVCPQSVLSVGAARPGQPWHATNINAQKRAAYAARKNFSVYSSLNMEPKPVTMQSISNVTAFSCDTLDAAGQQQLKNAHKRLLMTASKQPLGVEVGRAYDLNMKPLTKELTGAAERSTVSVPKQNVPYIVIHTHPDSNIFSQRDLSNFANNVNLKMLTAVGNDGHVYAVEKSASFDAKAVKTLVSDLGESVNGIADQYDRKEISYQEVAESLNFLVRNCLSELEGYGVKFYE